MDFVHKNYVTCLGKHEQTLKVAGGQNVLGKFLVYVGCKLSGNYLAEKRLAGSRRPT